MVTSVSDGDEEVKPSVEEDDETDCHFQPGKQRLKMHIKNYIL